MNVLADKVSNNVPYQRFLGSLVRAFNNFPKGEGVEEVDLTSACWKERDYSHDMTKAPIII